MNVDNFTNMYIIKNGVSYTLKSKSIKYHDKVSLLYKHIIYFKIKIANESLR